MKRILRIPVFLDTSPSAAKKWRSIKPAVYDFLSALAEANRENVDVQILVELCTFNDSVVSLTNGYALDPAKVLEMISRPGDDATMDLPEDEPYVETNELFVCKGLTNIGALCAYLDSRLTRDEGGLVPAAGCPDFAPIPVIITDLMHTSCDSLTAPWDKLHHNKFYNACKKIVVFFGPESRTKAAEALAGGPENVVTLNDRIIDYLAQVMFDSVILNSDSSHLEGANMTPQEIGDGIKDKIEKGRESAKELTETDKMMSEIERLLQ